MTGAEIRVEIDNVLELMGKSCSFSEFPEHLAPQLLTFPCQPMPMINLIGMSPMCPKN